jgi:hypothetical protein
MKASRSGHRVDQRGAVALEFAIVAPLLIMLIAGMVEFGFAYQAELAVTHAAREGARLASVNKYANFNVEDSANPLKVSGGLGAAKSESGDEVKVVVTYPYKALILPWLPNVTLRGEATLRKEY